uniref:Uncharacterized protein n=1 Tax=Timema tahoe TaxID=61484 RepID=A0A7R9IMX1_9NEOP|nr:unnamed protein product [Timema tahoe]
MFYDTVGCKVVMKDVESCKLEGSYQLCDFNINLNDVVQVMEKQVVDPSSSSTLNKDSSEETNKSEDKCSPPTPVMVTGVPQVFTNTGDGDWCAISVRQHR